MKRLLLIALLWPLASPATPAPALVSAATSARQQAEAELAAFRGRRLDEQAKLLRRVDRAQARLSAARAAVRAAEQRLDGARAAAARAVDTAAERGDRLDALDQRLAEAADVEPRLQRLKRRAAPHIETTTVHDRAGQPIDAPLLTLGPLRYAVARDPAAVGLVAGYPPRIAGPLLAPEQISGLRRLIEGAGGPIDIPLDLGGDLATAEVVPEWHVWGWLQAGGPFVWPILALGLAALLVTLDRLRVALVDRAPADLAPAVFAAFERGEIEAVRARVVPARNPMARLLAVGLRDRTPGALEAALAAEDVRLDRGLRMLAVFAGIAPLLGLLGTVSGMIGTFDVIAVHGTGEPRLLSGGIAQALTTTQLGLMVAVPTLLVHAVLSRLAERSRSRLEAAAARLADDRAMPSGES